MADERDATKIELLDHFVEIIGERIELVATAWFDRTTVPTPVMSDAAQALTGQIGHLVLPPIGVHGPGCEKNQGAARPPVSVEQPNAIACLDESHRAAFRRRHATRLFCRGQCAPA